MTLMRRKMIRSLCHLYQSMLKWAIDANNVFVWFCTLAQWNCMASFEREKSILHYYLFCFMHWKRKGNKTQCMVLERDTMNPTHSRISILTQQQKLIYA